MILVAGMVFFAYYRECPPPLHPQKKWIRFEHSVSRQRYHFAQLMHKKTTKIRSFQTICKSTPPILVHFEIIRILVYSNVFKHFSNRKFRTFIYIVLIFPNVISKKRKSPKLKGFLPFFELIWKKNLCMFLLLHSLISKMSFFGLLL